MADWKEALEELENGYEPAGVATDYAASIITHIEGLEAELRTRGDYVNEQLIVRAEAAEARVRELEKSLTAK